MRTVSLEELLEAGCHFGHQVTRQNPKARDYVFEARDGIHIIDLEKTKEGLEAAGAFVKSLASKPGTTIVILGSKRQAEQIIKDEVKRAREGGTEGVYSVTTRWIGGILTNFPEISKNFKRLQTITDLFKNEFEKANYTKKEISLFEKERGKLENFYGGIKDMSKSPDAVFIVDTHLEALAVREAMATKTPTVGITDTNADATIIDYPIPANDDAVGSIKLIVSYVVDAWIEGKKTARQSQEEAAKSKEQEAKGEEKSVQVVSSAQKGTQIEDKSVKGKEKKEIASKKTTKKAATKEKAVDTAASKIAETKDTPEKISVE